MGKNDHTVKAVTRKTVTLEFADGDMAGVRAECAARASVAAMLAFTAAPAQGSTIGEIMRSNFEVAMRFGDEVLRDWNLSGEDGKPLPATGESCTNLPDDWFQALMNAWTDKLVGVSVPLDRPSNDSNISATSTEPVSQAS